MVLISMNLEIPTPLGLLSEAREATTLVTQEKLISLAVT